MSAELKMELHPWALLSQEPRPLGSGARAPDLVALPLPEHPLSPGQGTQERGVLLSLLLTGCVTLSTSCRLSES